MSTEVKAFICDFCTRSRRRFATKSGADRHERQCFYNPIRRACASCKHFTFFPYIHEADTGYSEGGPYCEKDMLNLSPEASSQLRSECEGWAERRAGGEVENG